MDELAFWRAKIIQFFHDPPAKPFTGTRKTGRHTIVARELFGLFMGPEAQASLRKMPNPADWAAAGADRPMLYTPRRKGVSGLGTVTWPNRPEITHPLAPGYRLWLSGEAAADAAADAREDDEGEPRDLVEEQRKAAADLDAILARAGSLGDWNNPNVLKERFIALWRRFRDELASEHPNDPLWQELPADSRCPDHSIWDHLKVTTALAFMKVHGMGQDLRDEGAREPWMLRATLGPVSQFIDQSRTSRDLWIGSYLLADLTWAAIQPIARRYGPDTVIYPDLHANPRADCWLYEAHRHALSDDADPSTFAAVLPAAFVALVPRGGDGHLVQVEELAREAAQAVDQRWRELSDSVLAWLDELVGPQGRDWREIWARQHAHAPVSLTWTAIPWLPMGRIKNADSLRGRALPSQEERPIDPEDGISIAARRDRLAPWVPPAAWARYEHARDVFAHAQLDLHQMERGFDYAVTHHQIGARHALRQSTASAPAGAEEPGEKCTLCGVREALREDADAGFELGKARRRAREFWKAHKELDPDRTGEERLCAVCATRRFLVKADKDGVLFNRLWTGMGASRHDAVDSDGVLRLPFPSTATIAAQSFLAAVTADPRLEGSIAAVVRACRSAGLPRTSFPRALPRLAAVHSAGEMAEEFLKYEAEDVLFPEAIEGKARGAKHDGRERPEETERRLHELKAAVQTLRRKARGTPGTRIAILYLDGDRMSSLLLGEESAIVARWRDVLHPEVLERLPGRTHLMEAGWAALLDCHRLMGPSLHAFVSRALGHFSHRIVPWVVKREFSGRLIYAGGDEVLCIAPADEAIDLAARLQQLFSAAWVVDTDPLSDPWQWRRRTWTGTYDQAVSRNRFIIPLRRPAAEAIRFDDPEQPIAVHAADAGGDLAMGIRGTLLPMLGSGASLSAGIAVGHYKTPLSVLLRRSRELLRYAKDPWGDGVPGADAAWRGRAAVGVGHASRGGDKTQFALPWSNDDGDKAAQLLMRAVIQGFETARLPGRLPYKLRELALSARCALEAIGEREMSSVAKVQASRAVLRGLFDSCIDRRGAPADAAFAIWHQGIRLHGLQGEESYTDGVLFCREMARNGDEGGGW